jgi:hypothetical protein
MRTRRLGLISIGLALALDLAVGSSSTGLHAGDIEIVGDPHPVWSEAIELGRRFGTTTCAARTTDTTMLRLLSDAERIVVHQFAARRWRRDLDAVKTYVMRLLGAKPEGDGHRPACTGRRCVRARSRRLSNSRTASVDRFASPTATLTLRTARGANGGRGIWAPMKPGGSCGREAPRRIAMADSTGYGGPTNPM